MRRSVALPLVLALALAPAAWADHHLMQVNEVAPAGGQADQFIELRDPGVESFPATREYSVAAGTQAGPSSPRRFSPNPLRSNFASARLRSCSGERT